MVVASSQRSPREPKYYLVKRHLLELIETLPPGSLVPTERVLTVELDTSRTTVRQALSELVGEGRLVRRQGSGTYVAEPKISWPLQMTSFTEQAACERLLGQHRTARCGASASRRDVAARLAIKPAPAVYCIERLRLVDDHTDGGRDVIPVRQSVPRPDRPPPPRRIRCTRCWPTRTDVRPVAAEETIETAAASPREAELLNTDTGSPMLVLGRHSFDAAGDPIEWVRSWYRGDRYTFVARLIAPNVPGRSSSGS